ncbi:hypothetical protein CaCOL14_003712 [Colletotrichum acutatum]
MPLKGQTSIRYSGQAVQKNLGRARSRTPPSSVNQNPFAGPSRRTSLSFASRSTHCATNRF